jgi:hypothetical protein
MKSEPYPAINIINEPFKCCVELVSFARNISDLRDDFIDVRHEFNHACIALLNIQCQSNYVGGWEMVFHPKIKAVIINLGDRDWASMSCEHEGFLCRHLKHCAYLSGELISEQLEQIQSLVWRSGLLIRDESSDIHWRFDACVSTMMDNKRGRLSIER